MTPRRRALSLSALAFVPLVVAVYPEGAYAAFAFGLVDRTGVTPIHTVLSGAGPARRLFLSWPASVLCWVAGVLAVAIRVRPAVSAALFGLAAVAAFRFSLWLSGRADYFVLPVGAVVFGGVAVWLYRE